MPTYQKCGHGKLLDVSCLACAKLDEAQTKLYSEHRALLQALKAIRDDASTAHGVYKLADDAIQKTVDK